ncbi:MAG: DUF4476 domain-containing protein [Tannerellaceae bacterium]
MTKSFLTLLGSLFLITAANASTIDGTYYTETSECIVSEHFSDDPYAAINDSDTDEQKLSVARQLSTQHYFSVNEIRQLTSSISCEKTKLDAFISLYDSCIDKHTFFTLSKNLDSKDLKTELIHFVDNSCIHEF